MVSAATTWLSVKLLVPRTPGRVIPEAPARNCAAGLCAKRSSGVPPGTRPAGASGMTVIRSASAVPWVEGRYGLRTPR